MASPTLQPAANVVIELVAVDVPSRTERERVVIPGLNWSVREREFWVVGGLPGSGKSDLLAMLAALNVADEYHQMKAKYEKSSQELDEKVEAYSSALDNFLKELV